MLIATWIITFVLIVGIGVYAGTKITNLQKYNFFSIVCHTMQNEAKCNFQT